MDSASGREPVNANQPFCLEVNEGALFAFAGIWDHWRDSRGNAIETCAILTTIPNSVTAPVHDRMPVILDPDSYDLARPRVEESR
jgi:putative SOS response-associated peptidase YedK